MIVDDKKNMELVNVVRVLAVAGILALMLWNSMDGFAQGIDARLAISPTLPVETEPVEFWVYGTFPDPSHFVISATATLDGEHVTVDVQTGGTDELIVTPVLEPFRVSAGELSLRAGAYTADLILNDTLVETIEFDVNPRLGLPDVPFYEPMIEVVPEHPLISDEVVLIVRGWLPDTASFIERAAHTVEGNRIVLELDLARDGFGAEVLTLATQDYVIGALDAGEYFVSLRVGDEPVTRAYFVVRESEDDPIHLPRVSAEVVWRPSQPADGDVVQFFIEGEFPTPGYDVVQVTPLGLRDGVITYDVRFVPPEDPTITVIEPFFFNIGALALDEGTYAVEATVDGQALETPPVEVAAAGAGSALSLRWEGGFAGIQSWMRVREHRFVERHHDFGNGTESGWLPGDVWDTLVNAMDEAAFTSLPDVFPPEGIIADGFLYSITYADHTVDLYDGASFPDEVAAIPGLVRMLFERPLESSRVTSVEGWAQH